MKRRKRNPQNATLRVKIITYGLLLIAAFISLFPFYLMFVSSTLSTGEILKIPPTLSAGSNLMANMDSLKDKTDIW
ncbi:MAG TPA: carbohydrate ABC transporter permease, partial [Bacillota bacterium]|nr:carbohydrate ABC transporter permease [Bacillota bacterium]